MIDFDKTEDYFLHKHVKMTIFIIMTTIIIIYFIIEVKEDELEAKQKVLTKKEKIVNDFWMYLIQGSIVGLFTSVGILNSIIASFTFCIIHSCILLVKN